TSFDEPDAEPAAAVEPPPEPPCAPPPITEAELEAVRAESFAAGHRAGVEEERAASERRRVEALERIAAALAASEEIVATGSAAAERRAVDTALAVARAVAPELLRRNGVAEVEATLRDCLRDLIDEPRLVVRVAAEVLDTIKERLPALTGRTGFSGRVILLAEEGMPPGDCRIEWADGGVERNTARLMHEIDMIAARFRTGLDRRDEAPA